MLNTAIMLARRAEPPAGPLTGGLMAGDPFAAGRVTAFRDDAGVAAGTVRLGRSSVDVAMTHAEVLVVLSGALTAVSAAGSIRIGPNEAVVLPRGLSATIETDGDTVFAFMAMTAPGGAGEVTDAVRLDPSLPRRPSPGPAPEVLLGPAPSSHACNLFTDSSGMRAGVWDLTTPNHRTYVPHRVHELMHFIEGTVTLTHQDGSSVTVGAGDTVFLPRGAPYAWKSVEPVVKYYAVL